ncbi:LysR family transcriptional regulator [Psychrobacter aestuarii]|uniref:LysR family transcriptional regulator n=1 Tax=Psychrobacter aestuarii TaxID=556327 RepID=A0ABP3FD95_9GAMM|nr:LysR family transcriptional regulator [Psychrobacter aestuarii]
MLLEGIETLLVLSEAKTMSKTGSLLFISQSAVSKRIHKLEKKLGKKLIEPQGRYVRLTHDAMALIESVGPTFNELRGQIHDQSMMDNHKTPIHIDCSETLIFGYFSDLLAAAIQQDKHLILSTNHTPIILENVKSGKATIGLSAGHLPNHTGLLTFHLFDEPFYIISQQPLTDLPATLITTDLSNPANAYQSAVLDTLGITPLMQLDSYHAAARLALSGAAAALMPLSIIRGLGIHSAHTHSFSALDALVRPVSVCVRQKNYSINRVQQLVKTLCDYKPPLL